MPVTAGVHMEAKEGSQDLFVPLETQDAELWCCLERNPHDKS